MCSIKKVAIKYVDLLNRILRITRISFSCKSIKFNELIVLVDVKENREICKIRLKFVLRIRN